MVIPGAWGSPGRVLPHRAGAFSPDPMQSCRCRSGGDVSHALASGGHHIDGRLRQRFVGRVVRVITAVNAAGCPCPTNASGGDQHRGRQMAQGCRIRDKGWPVGVIAHGCHHDGARARGWYDARTTYACTALVVLLLVLVVQSMGMGCICRAGGSGPAGMQGRG